MFDPSILPPLPPMAKQPPWLPPSILPPLPPMPKQPPWVPLGTKDCSQGFCSIYCPQWCYIVFPPPPPFFFEDAAADDNNNSSGSPTFSPLVITIIGILASAFLLISYYAIVSKFCRDRRQHQHHRHRDDGLDNNEDDAVSLSRSRRRDNEEWHVPPTVGLDEAFIAKITVCKYKRGGGLVGCSDCSVCLSEFREGESLRLLPKCSHAFHVPCIDTWLKSHSNCPLCRANILPAEPPQLPAPPPPEAEQPEGVRNVGETAAAAAGTSMENAYGSDSSTSKEFDVLIGIGEDESQRMRRSFSMDSFPRGRVSVADILGGEAEDGETVVVGSRGEHSKGSSSLHCDSPVAGIKRTLSSGRFCLTRQGRGRDRGRGRNSLLLPI